MREQLETIEEQDLSGIIGGCGPLCRLLKRLVARLEGAGASAQPGAVGAAPGGAEAAGAAAAG